MNIAIEEYIEDAIVAALKLKLPGEIDLRAAYKIEGVRFPAVIVAVTGNANTSNDIEAVTESRAITGEVQLITEYKNICAKDGTLILTSREQSQVLRRAVSRILAERNLVVQLNASPDVIFSTFFMGDIRRGNAGTEIETVIPFDAIAVARNQEI